MRLLEGDGRDDVEDAEGGDDQDAADDGVDDDVADGEDLEHPLVRLLPGLAAVADAGLDPGGDVPGPGHVVEANADLVDDVRPLQQHLHLLQQRVAGGLVQRDDAAVDQTHHLHLQHHPVGRGHRQRRAELGGELPGEAVAEDDAVGGAEEVVEAADDHVGFDLRDLAFALGLDPDQRGRHLLAAVAQDHLAAEDRRRGDPRHGVQRRQLGAGIADAAELVLGLHPAQAHGRALELPLHRLERRVAELVLDHHVRRRVDDAADEVALRALHQRRHGDGEADAGGHPQHRQRRLPGAAADMGQRDADEEPPGEAHEPRPAPLRTPGGRGPAGRPATPTAGPGSPARPW